MAKVSMNGVDKMINKYNRMIEQFKLYYPDLYSDTVNWWPSGRFHITIRLNNGTEVEYDNVSNLIRFNNYNKENEITKTNAIGRNINRVLISKGIKQKELAETSGITSAMLSRYINGTSIPRSDTLIKIAHCLNCSINELCDITEP